MTRWLPASRVDMVWQTQLGSSVLTTAFVAAWAAWCAGARVRHRKAGVRVTGAMMVGLGALVVASLPLVRMTSEMFSITALLWTVAAVAGVAGYLSTDGTEPVSTFGDATSEILHVGLLAVILGGGAFGLTIMLGMCEILVPCIASLVGGTPWSDGPGIERIVLGARHQHAVWGFGSVPVAWTVLSVLVFPTIWLQRRFAR